MVDQKNIVALEYNQLQFDVEPVFEAYIKMATYFTTSVPSLIDVYNQYQLDLNGQIMNFQAQFYGDEVYDGSPGSRAKKLLPDSMSGTENPFQELSVGQVQAVLEHYRLSYSLRGHVFNIPVVGVW